MTEREEIQAPGLCDPISHYTDAVRFGDLVFVSGCAPLDEKGEVVGGDDVVAQARQVLENLGRCLDAAGSGFDQVLKVTVYMTDVNERTAITPLREEFFGAARPASTLVEVSALALPGMRVEIEAVAAVRA